MDDLHGEILTRTDVARIFAVHPATVSKWLKAARIPFFRTPGGQARYHRADIEAFLVASEVQRSA